MFPKPRSLSLGPLAKYGFTILTHQFKTLGLHSWARRAHWVLMLCTFKLEYLCCVEAPSTCLVDPEDCLKTCPPLRKLSPPSGVKLTPL